MSMSLGFLLVVFMALFGFAVVIAIMVALFRAATRSSDRRPTDAGFVGIPPVITNDSMTNPANPLYHLHHPTAAGDSSTHNHSPSPGSTHSAFDSTPSSPPSFDSGSTSSPSFDSGSSSPGCDSGSNCG